VGLLLQLVLPLLELALSPTFCFHVQDICPDNVLAPLDHCTSLMNLQDQPTQMQP
jgi:hypothetical protein